jgi:hypothetical protein
MDVRCNLVLTICAGSIVNFADELVFIQARVTSRKSAAKFFCS